MRVAIYARFSSDLQDARSVTDQLMIAREYARRHGWQVVAEFSDAAISGAVLRNRPGLLELLAAARERRFDIVLTESLDRLSRSLADTARMHEDLSYLGVQLHTLADGLIGTMHVGMKGTIAKIFLEDLAQKTRRGQIGRVMAGRIPGGRCYGYDCAKDGEPGKRSINETEAAVVRRIFREYVQGCSPLAIVTALNREGIAAPRGNRWNASTLNGSRKRANGILSNSLYIGVITFNRQRFLKDPATGRRQSRPNAPSEWLATEVPELRIVDQETWDLARARREADSKLSLPRRNRPRHLLSGLLECGACGSSYIVVNNAWLGCSAVRNKGTCENRRVIRVSEVEERVLDALQHHLLAPEVVATAVEAYRAERSRLAHERAQCRVGLDRELAETRRKIANVTKAVEAGGDLALLVPRLNALSRQQRDAEEKLRAATNRQPRVLHAEATDRYRQKVAALRQMSHDRTGTEALGLVRELIGRIVIKPAPGRCRLPLDVVGDLAVLMCDEQDTNLVPMAVVAGVGFEPTTFRL